MKQINPTWRRHYQLKRAVTAFEFEKPIKNRNRYNWKAKHNLAVPFQKCSQCHHWMRGDIAKIQIENKRENAPICFACIIGINRKSK